MMSTNHSSLFWKNISILVQLLFVTQLHAISPPKGFITLQQTVVDGITNGFNAFQSLLPSSRPQRLEDSPLAHHGPLVWSDESFGNITSTSSPFQLVVPVYQHGKEFHVILSDEPLPGFDDELSSDWEYLRDIVQGNTEEHQEYNMTRPTITEWILRRDIQDLCEPPIERLVNANEVSDHGSSIYRLRLLAKHTEHCYCIWEDDPHLQETIATEEDQRCSSCLAGEYWESSNVSDPESLQIQINTIPGAEGFYATEAIITHHFQNFYVGLTFLYPGDLPREYWTAALGTEKEYLEWKRRVEPPGWIEELKVRLLDVCGPMVRELASDSHPITLESTFFRRAEKLRLEKKDGSFDWPKVEDIFNDNLRCTKHTTTWANRAQEQNRAGPISEPRIPLYSIDVGYSFPAVKHDQVEILSKPGYLTEVQFNGTRYLYRPIMICSSLDPTGPSIRDIDYAAHLLAHENRHTVHPRALVDWDGLYGGILFEYVDLTGPALTADCLFNCPINLQRRMALEISIITGQLADTFNRTRSQQEWRSKVFRTSGGESFLTSFEDCSPPSRFSFDDRFSGPETLGDPRWASTIWFAWAQENKQRTLAYFAGHST